MVKRLLLLNGFAAIAIPMHHAAAYGLLAMFQWTDRYRPVEVPNYDLLGSPPYFAMIALRLVLGYAIPSFLFVSGFFVAFMARGTQTRLNLTMVLPRIKVLLVPFFLWSVFRFILIKSYPNDVNEFLDPYHFIPLLIQFYLLSPLLMPLAKKRWKLFLFSAALLQIIMVAIRYSDNLGVVFPGQEQILNMTPRWLFINQPFWFPFGVVVGLRLELIAQQLEKYRGFFLLALAIFAISTMVEYQVVDHLNGDRWLGPVFGGISRQLYSLAFILTVISSGERSVPYSKEISQISAKSLGIYMMNIPAIYVTASLMYHLTPWLLGVHLIYMVVLFIAGLGGPLLLMEAIRRTPTRRGYRLLFG